MLGLALSTGAVSAGAEGLVAAGDASALQAEEVAQRTDPAVLAASSSATLEGQFVEPAISDRGAELSSTGALTGSTISKETAGEFAVDTRDGELSLTPLGASAEASTPTVVDGTAALFADTWPGADAIVRPDPLGATTIVQMRSPEAPTSFSWEVGLGPDQHLRQLVGGGVAVVEGPPASVGPPWKGRWATPWKRWRPTLDGPGAGDPGRARARRKPRPSTPRPRARWRRAEQQTGGAALMVIELLRPPTPVAAACPRR